MPAPGQWPLSAEGAIRTPGGAARLVPYPVSRNPATRETTTAAVVSLVEAALRASEAGLRILVDATVRGVARVTTAGSALYANDAMLRLVGYGRFWPESAPGRGATITLVLPRSS